MPRNLIFVAGLTLLCACRGSGGGSNDNSGGGEPLNAGLDERPQNLTCVAPSLGADATEIVLEPAFTNLNFAVPLALLQAPGDDSRWFALERAGTVRVFENVPGVSAFDADFITIAVNTSGEGGLLGMAFAPDFATSGQVYLSWTEGSPLQSVVARFTSTDGGTTLDPGSMQEIIRVNQDFSNHNGGHIAFGPDGYLYFGLGDGGSGGDPNGRGQDTRNLLGAMLRLDVSSAAPGYTIPPDNPFAGNANCPGDHSSATSCPEIYAWGLRNPWRWSFDTATGALWLGDVGQSAREEVDRIELGGNYGWDCREGFAAYEASCAASPGLVDPVFDYDRAAGDASITGGFVYRGTTIPGLIGSYVFGDYVSGRVWRLVEDGFGGYSAVELIDHTANIFSFAAGNDGELYVLSNGIYRIAPSAGGAPAGGAVAAQLSATGCFDPQNPALPVTGLVPYDVNAPSWSDGAEQERWIAIPDGTTIALDEQGDFQFPPGTVLARHFRLGAELVETQLLMRHPGGSWAGYTYEWNAAGTDAELVSGGKVAAKGGQDWIYPSGGDCMRCHTSAAGFSLGLELAQLNADFTYEATGRTRNQLATLDSIGMFAGPLGDPAALPALADPGDADADPGRRARSYLHANCAYCHRPSGPTSVDIDLRAGTLLENTNACNVAPSAGDLGIANALLIAPGEPARSVLPARAAVRDSNAMPPLASNLVDSAGVALLESWIAGIDVSCR